MERLPSHIDWWNGKTLKFGTGALKLNENENALMHSGDGFQWTFPSPESSAETMADLAFSLDVLAPEISKDILIAKRNIFWQVGAPDETYRFLDFGKRGLVLLGLGQGGFSIHSLGKPECMRCFQKQWVFSTDTNNHRKYSSTIVTQEEAADWIEGEANAEAERQRIRILSGEFLWLPEAARQPAVKTPQPGK